MDKMDRASRLVTVFGGSGFLGRHVVRTLAKRGYRVRVAVRRPNSANFLQTSGGVGQVETMQANLRFPSSIARAVEDVDAVVNLVGILAESGRQRFDQVQAEGPGEIAEAAPAGIPFVHVSALGADLRSRAEYARTKAQGEAQVTRRRPDAIIVRPSIIFGQGDSFFNRFATLARALPVLPIAGAETRFQPVFAGDVAEAIARAVDGQVAGGRIYELGGPETLTLREIVEYVLSVIERRRLVLPLPFGIADVQARILTLADTLTLGLMPDALKLTRDQVELLRTDNVVSAAAEGEGRTLKGLGITPRTIEAIAPSYLERFRKTGQFERAV